MIFTTLNAEPQADASYISFRVKGTEVIRLQPHEGSSVMGCKVPVDEDDPLVYAAMLAWLRGAMARPLQAKHSIKAEHGNGLAIDCDDLVFRHQALRFPLLIILPNKSNTIEAHVRNPYGWDGLGEIRVLSDLKKESGADHVRALGARLVWRALTDWLRAACATIYAERKV